MFRRTLIVALLALGLMLGTAQAGIIASIVDNPTASNMPFLLESFGTGGVSGLVSSASFTTITGVGVSFTGTSGVYVGDVSGLTRSPFRTSGGGPDTQRYLDAQPGSSVVLSYTSQQTAFNLLWGSVDPSPDTWNQLTFTFSGGGGSYTVTGADVVTGLSGVVNGTTNLAVSITDLAPFEKVTVTASQPAFEFVPGVPVPDGGTTLMLLGGALVGLGALRRKFRA